MDVQVRIVTMDQLKCNVFVTIINLMIVGSFAIFVDKYKFWYLGVIAVMQFTELAMFIILRARQITTFLGIRIFVIKPNNQVANI